MSKKQKVVKVVVKVTFQELADAVAYELGNWDLDFVDSDIKTLQTRQGVLNIYSNSVNAGFDFKDYCKYCRDSRDVPKQIPVAAEAAVKRLFPELVEDE